LTWTYATPTNIESPIAPASIERIGHSGDLLLVWNNNGESGPGYYKAKRTPLTLAISNDDGNTWNHLQNIEDASDGFYCYTAIHFVGDYVLLAYLSKLESDEGYGITMRRLRVDELYSTR
jgi:hypothetical protein